MIVEKRIKPLKPPDSIHLKAAEGWLVLGNHVEPNEELENITPQFRVHPDVLEIRWQITTEEFGVNPSSNPRTNLLAV